MIATIALLTEEHFVLIALTFALDATFALRTLPVVVAHARCHAMWHLHAAWVYCKKKTVNILLFDYSNISLFNI